MKVTCVKVVLPNRWCRVSTMSLDNQQLDINPKTGEGGLYELFAKIGRWLKAAVALEQFSFETGPHPLMGMPTLNVGTVRGALNINSVPDAAEMSIDIRSVAGQDHGALLQCLCRVLGPQIGLRALLDVGSVYTAPDDPWMQRVFAICSARSSNCSGSNPARRRDSTISSLARNPSSSSSSGAVVQNTTPFRLSCKASTSRSQSNSIMSS